MALDFTNWVGFNFRGALSHATFPGDGVGETPIYDNTTGAFNGDYGWSGVPAVHSQVNTAGYDRRTFGWFATSSGSQQFLIVAPNNNYKLRLAMNLSSKAIIIDVANGSYGYNGQMTAGGNATINNYLVTLDGKRLYKVTTTGSYTTGNPVGTGAGIADGGNARFTFIANVLLIINNGSTAANATVVDVDGAERSALANAGWAVAGTGGTQPIEVPITIAGGGITILTAGGNFGIRHVALKVVQTPLADAIVTDEYGTTTTAPTLYAQQPQGYAALTVSAPVGANNWSIDPACDLAPYLAVDTTSKPGKTLIVANGTRMPDSMAGVNKTLKLVQTDPSGGVSGSPYTTTLNCTVVAVGARDLSAGIRGRICSQAAAVVLAVEGARAAMWQGYQGSGASSDFVADVSVTNASEWLAAYNGFNPPPGNTGWYRIQCKGPGPYESPGGAQIVASKDFGSGGLLVEPYPGHDPEWHYSIKGVIRGLHVRGMKMPFLKVKSGAFEGFNFDVPGSGVTFYSRAKFSNNRIGTMFAAGADETLIATDDYTRKGDTKFIFSYIMESLEVVDNVFDGAGQGITPCCVRTLIVDRNEQIRATGDFVGYAPMQAYYRQAPVDAFGDNNLFVSIQNNVAHHELSFAGFTTGVHLDFRQMRLMGGLTGGARRDNKPRVDANPAGTPPTPDVPWAVGDTMVLRAHVYTVSAITTGYTGTTPPTPSGGTAGAGQVDGGVTWDHTLALPRIKIKEVMAGNTSHSHIEQAGDAARQFYFENAEETLWEVEAAVFDNAVATAAQNFITPGEFGKVYAEFNTGVSPSHTVTAFNSTAILALSSDTKILARNNIVGSTVVEVPGILASYGNVVANFLGVSSGATFPGNVMAGTPSIPLTYNTPSARTEWAGMVDLPTTPKDQIVMQMRKALRPKAGIGAGCSVTIPFTVAPGAGMTGTPLNTQITLVP